MNVALKLEEEEEKTSKSANEVAFGTTLIIVVKYFLRLLHIGIVKTDWMEIKNLEWKSQCPEIPY